MRASLQLFTKPLIDLLLCLLATETWREKNPPQNIKGTSLLGPH